MKSVLIRSFSSPCFPALGLNTERNGVSLRIQSKYGKIRTRKTPNTDTFHAVLLISAKYENFFICCASYHSLSKKADTSKHSKRSEHFEIILLETDAIFDRKLCIKTMKSSSS